jgi:hypothetical protein
LAISSGMQFNVDDFDDFYKDRPDGFRAGYWIGSCNEWCYTMACGLSRGQVNIPAARSYEKMKGRSPFFIGRRRVAVRARLSYNKEGVPKIGEVTSFNDKNGILTLTVRRHDHSARDGDGSGAVNVDRLIKLDRAQVRTHCVFI